MLRHTFCHLPGVGESVERRLWARGLATWDAALAATGHRLSADDLRASADHYGRGNPAWFAASLPSPQLWRLFADFRDRCAYLDIETTGMGPTAHVTAIALYDGRAVRTYVHGRNLDDFAADVADYRLPPPRLAVNPFRPDPEAVRRVVGLRQRFSYTRG